MDLTLSASHVTCSHRNCFWSRFWRPPSHILLRLQVNRHKLSLLSFYE
jgi:hypothetical protein